MAAEGVIPSQNAWSRVVEAVKRTEGGRTYYTSINQVPYTMPPAIARITGVAVEVIAGIGTVYPGEMVYWDSDTEAWVAVEQCYILEE